MATANFSKKAKMAAAVYQGIDPAGMHADHIQPRSAGGSSDVSNCEWLFPNVNQRKSNHMITLREWQSEFIKAYDACTDRSFLLVAIPGGGKTIAALTVAKRFLQAGNDRRVLIVVPTRNLQEQWRDDATKFGINIQTKELGTNFRDGFVGGAITYQSLDTMAQVLRKICSTGETLVIMDEPHHCGDKDSWGANAKVAFELATKRLLLSGTPFRTDRQPIPFITYNSEGVCVPNYRYDYPYALRDGVVRHLSFIYDRGAYKQFYEGSERNFELHTELSDDEAAERLRPILDARGEFPEGLIRQSHQRLSIIRQTIPDAAAMAVCIDQAHAMQIAAVIRRVTGCDPSIIVSDEDIATDTVKQFRHATSQWLVSVRQVSEGTDIKRLQVLCYLTNTTTEIFFRQVIGRVSRVRYLEQRDVSDDIDTADCEAFVFLPADPRLVKNASNIEQSQDQAIREDAEDYLRNTRETDYPDYVPPVFLGSTHDGTELVIVGSKQYSAVDAGRIAEIAAKFGVGNDKAALIFDEYETRHAPIRHEVEPAETSLEEKINAMRRDINKKANHYARCIDRPVKEIHGRWKRQATMGLTELEEKLYSLNRLIKQFYDNK